MKDLIKKFIGCILALAIMIIIASCSGSASSVKSNCFEMCEMCRYPTNGYICYDVETHVMYWFSNDHAFAMPLYNSNGTLKLYGDD